MKKISSPCILYVSTFPPRECGIATFTQDLTNAIDKEFGPRVKSRILAVNDNHTVIYNYPPKTIMQIREGEMEDYLLKAAEINKLAKIKLVNIQHEYGIFGGSWGNYLLPFMEVIKKPIIVSMHTVLPRPEDRFKKITQAIAAKAAGIVVMTNRASKILQEQYAVKKSKIYIIPHGVHHIAFPSKTNAKKKLKLSKRIVLSTFGMLNRDKGIEFAIKALPKAVEKYPSLLYLIIGATHPAIRKEEGEKYRNRLKELVFRLKLEEYVKFYDKYLSLPELIEYLKATDIYLSPSLNPAQAVSGTISYALSCACPIIATASQYGKEVISRQRGVLVGFRNHRAILRALLKILANKRTREAMKKNAYFFSRRMTWQNVAHQYFKTFNNFAKIMPRGEGKLPGLKLNHLIALTDDFGIIQFARHTKPDLGSGYCLDDNARAMLACLLIYRQRPDQKILDLIGIYLKFIKFAQRPDGQFYNFITVQKIITDKSISEDSYGRAVWALGYLLTLANLPPGLIKQARAIFNKASQGLTKIKSCRARAFAIIGLSYALESFGDKPLAGRNYEAKTDCQKKLRVLADKLARQYNRQAAKPENIAKRWFWFEDWLTYSNYRLPESLLFAYRATRNKDYLVAALKGLKFLESISFEKNYFSPIGQNGWYFRDGRRAYFDQQPEDAASAAEALVSAYEVTKKAVYAQQAKIAFEWFLGKNHLNQMIYDEATGGCYDGLGRNSINFNQGAESTISYLLARLAMEKIK